MPTLDFKGKSFVYTHHLSVPFRELLVDAKKSELAAGARPSLDNNLIIHGDNLHALKALLPIYAGKVDCIYIDPPYNTGNEGWCYNDNVRSPLMKEWLKKSANPVEKDDLERHEKWLCMMWPRLKLLHELLAEDGVIFISIDDNEVQNLAKMCDDIFDVENRFGIIVVRNNPRGRRLGTQLAVEHEYLLAYAKKLESFSAGNLQLSDEQVAEYTDLDGDGKKCRLLGLRKRGALSKREDRPNLHFPLFVNPNTKAVALEGKQGWTKVVPKLSDGSDGVWRWGKEKIERDSSLLVGKLVKRRETGATEWDVFERDYAMSEGGELVGRLFPSIWQGSDFNNETGRDQITRIFGAAVFDYPKPVGLITHALLLSGKQEGVFLDSFAGSGTTAQAILELNKKDGGNRKFILVECEDYADKLAAERIRRIIKGYKFEGTQRQELLREPLTWTKLQKAAALVEKAESIEKFEGNGFDKVTKTVEDGALVVTGEKKITEKVEGLGGSFTFCTLGEEMSIDRLLAGGKLPSFDALAKYVFYTATGRTLADVPKQKPDSDGFIGETEFYRVHLFYKPEKKWLASNDAALTEQLVEKILASNKEKKRLLVFAAAKFMAQKELTRQGVEFCQLPYAIHRILGD